MAADEAGRGGSGAPVPLAQLLPEPSRFPAGYPPVVLDPAAAGSALRGVNGVPEGATVTPGDCTPPEPTETVAMSSVTEQGTLTVVVTRMDASLQDRRDQLDRCGVFTVQTELGSSTVTAQLLPSPPVAVDALAGDSLAVEQTQDDTSPGRALTLAAQYRDVRVLVSMSVGEDMEIDTVALDGVFTEAVAAVLEGARR